jgi:WD40 repeat protein
MELSPQFQGSHTTASVSGQYIAALHSRNCIRVYATHAPDRRFSDISIRIQLKDVTALKWNHDDSRIAVLSAKFIEVINLDDASNRVRIDNGSGGLGRFSDADFVGREQLLVIWEFGKAKIWDLSTGRGWELGDVKGCCDGSRWQMRPNAKSSVEVLAMLSRAGADDVLTFSYLAAQKQLVSVKLPTADTQSISWSPDGRWLAVLDVPTSAPCVHFFTPDGHLYRSYPPVKDGNTVDLAVKAVVWARNAQLLALTKFDGRIILLNTRTFTTVAVIEHTTHIDQHTSNSTESQAPIWQEAVSASGERSYKAIAQPFSPPLTRTKASPEPGELGVAEACFSEDGSWLATRDERMQNTVWIWNTTTLAAHAVLVQHSNVRKLAWHSTRPDQLLMDCGEGIAYLFTPSESSPPEPIMTSTSAHAVLSWLNTAADSRIAFSAVTKSMYRLIYPEGQPDPPDTQHQDHDAQNGAYEEGASEDSIFDLLSGRTPLPPKTEQSYTERVDLEMETEEEDMTTRMDDTFRGKGLAPAQVDVDPLDDSDIF